MQLPCNLKCPPATLRKLPPGMFLGFDAFARRGCFLR